MTTWTPEKIRIEASNAGFRQGDDVVMTAIILAESGGVTDRVSKPNPDGTRDYGLAQINSSHFGEKLDGGVFGFLASKILNSNVLTPEINLKFANILYRHRGGAGNPNRFNDWAAYNNGSYKAFLPQAQAAPGVNTTTNQDSLNNGNLSALPGAVSDSYNQGKDYVVNSVTSWANGKLLNVGIGTVAVLGIILGFVILIASSRAAKTVAGAAVKVA